MSLRVQNITKKAAHAASSGLVFASRRGSSQVYTLAAVKTASPFSVTSRPFSTTSTSSAASFASNTSVAADAHIPNVSPAAPSSLQDKASNSEPISPSTPASPMFDRVFMKTMLETLRKQTREFVLLSSQIRVIETPPEFYDSIISNISSAKERVCLSALYLGSAAQEQALIDALQARLESTPSLCTHLLFDHWRGQRPDSSGRSSFALAQETVQRFPQRASAAFYAPLLSPAIATNVSNFPNFAVPAAMGEQIRGGIFQALLPRLPGRVKELLAVHHMKVYIFDDKVILSGANLSDIYFQTRQDRYVEITSKALCDYLLSVIQVVSLSSRSSLIAADASSTSSPQSSTTSRLEPIGSCVTPLPEFWVSEPAWDGGELTRLLRQNGRAMLATPGAEVQVLASLFFPGHAPTDATDGVFAAAAAQDALLHTEIAAELQKESISTSTSATEFSEAVERGEAPSPHVDSLPLCSLFPSLQMGTLGIRQDESVMTSVLSALDAISRSPYAKLDSGSAFSLHFLTGYFNMTKGYAQALGKLAATLPGRNRIRVSAASEGANGWAGAKGPTGHVPRLYTFLAQRFLRIARGSDEENTSSSPHKMREVDIEVLEYARPGWSYHAKGFFAQPYSLCVKPKMIKGTLETGREKEIGEHPLDGLDPERPLITMFGSSNFGERSLNRDTELNFTLLCTDPVLVGAMGQDLRRSTRYGKPLHVAGKKDVDLEEVNRENSGGFVSKISREKVNDWALKTLALPIFKYFL